MKLQSLLPNVAKLEVIHPTLGATGIILTLLGPDSKQVREKVKGIIRLNVGKKEITGADVDAVEKQGNELVATAIVGWTGIEDDNGKEIPYTPEKALELINDPGLAFMKEQIDVFINERKHFFRPASE
jgi:hypothetical protein